MTSLVEQHCATIREQGTALTSEQLKTFFDEFVSELNKTNTLSMNITLIKQIVSTLVNIPNKSHKLAEIELIIHPLMIFLRDNVLIDLLRRRQNKDIEYDLLINLSILFSNIYSHTNATNVHVYKQLLLEKSLIDELVSCFDEISTYGKNLDNSQLLNSIHLLLVALHRLEKKQIEINETSLTKPLFSAILKCLCSSYTIDTLKGLEQNFSQNLTERQILLLSECPQYVRWYSTNDNCEQLIQIPQALLHHFTEWAINSHPDSIIHCSQDINDMMRHLNTILVRPVDWNMNNILNKEFYDDYCKLALHWSLFLSILIKHSSNESKFMSITRFIVQDLYNLTLHSNVLDYMKSLPNLISMLLKMIDIQQDETQLNVYRCLGKIMTEEDIKTMDNPNKIAIIYVKFLSNSIDDLKKKSRFYSLLESLKNWVQHDQVKIELINQKILPLLIRCVMETKFDSIKVQKPSLEILLALSFNNDAALYLKENQNFMNHIRNLSSKTNTSDHSSLQRAGEGLLWKLEKETAAIIKSPSSNSYKYDIMISYSHSDKQLCHKIQEKLSKDGFRVWIDRDQMHGSTMIAMADAIENSNIILICMSDAYKQSVYCQSEAHYAFEKRRHLIPLIMKSHYKPDGWLGIIVSGKLYIDFVKNEFNSTYEKLKIEINQHIHRIETNSKEKDHQNKSLIVIQPIEDISQYSIIELPHCIIQWTNDHVKSFLISIGLKNTLLILCIKMDGHRLLQLYEMCMINRESMFQTLKTELNEIHNKLMPINDYITFIHEIKRYVPLTPIKDKIMQPEPISSVVCSVM